MMHIKGDKNAIDEFVGMMKNGEMQVTAVQHGIVRYCCFCIVALCYENDED